MKDRNIIVATDFSDRSFAVIKKAQKFAEKRGAHLHIVHILQKGFFSNFDAIDAIRDSSYEILTQKVRGIDKEHFHCVAGELDVELKSSVEFLDAALVIISSSGERSHLKEFFLGSSTKEIVRAVHVPTLIVKTDRELSFKNIMIPSDLSQKSHEHILKVQTLFPQAYIVILHTYTVPFEGRLGFYGMHEDEIVNFQHDIKLNARENAYRFYEGLHLDQSRVKLQVKEGPIDTGFFLQEASSLQCDLISLHTSGKFSFFAFDLLGDAKQDVLMMRL